MQEESLIWALQSHQIKQQKNKSARGYTQKLVYKKNSTIVEKGSVKSLALHRHTYSVQIIK